jgi:hypothetical protein
MQTHWFSKTQLEAKAQMLDVDDKTATLSDKKKRMWV